MSKPLWSDQKIVAAAQINRSESDVVHMLFGMRDSYEQRLAELEDENQRLRRDVKDKNASLAVAADDIAELQAEVASLRAELRNALNATVVRGANHGFPDTEMKARLIELGQDKWWED